jgi:[ribosomal protein S5]-alanine N-acetyltransferase
MDSFISARLSLDLLTSNDKHFILELLNTPGWLKFIGDRNIQTAEEAEAYIQRISENPNVTYWVVRLRNLETPIGVITLIKRDYLEGNDIGFAFLPGHAKSGFAFEATSTILDYLFAEGGLNFIHAITIPDNFDSIRLLDKCGFKFERQILVEGQNLLLYMLELKRIRGPQNAK